VDATFLASCVQVLQTGSKETLSSKTVLSSSEAPVIGIVDRSANLEDAAEALLTARFSFGGNSPYAPDVVLVNEFVKKEFLNAVIRKSINFLTGRNENEILDENNTRGRRPQDTSFQDRVTSLKGVKVITSGSNSTIVEVTER
jgi:aldehyde dehydrogenase (NAD+)